MGSILKKISVVFLVLSFIGSIVLGTELGGRNFDWIIFLIAFISSSIFYLLIYAVGEILDTLDNMNNNLYVIAKIAEKTKVQEKTEPVSQSTYIPKSYTNRAATVMKQGNGTWTCKTCGTKNESNAQYCKDCGKYK